MNRNDSSIVSPGLPDNNDEPSLDTGILPLDRPFVEPTIADVVEEQDVPAQSVSVDHPEPILECPFTVTRDNVVVEEVLREAKIGSVYIPEDIANKDRSSDVVVVGAGPQAQIWVRDESMPPRTEYDQQWPKRVIQINVGDVLIVHKHQMVGLTLAENDRELKVLTPDAIIGIVEDR